MLAGQLTGELDWPEDFSHENGQYNCVCITCQESFVGHKRRITCKLCADKAAAEYAALSPEEKAERVMVFQQAWQEYFAKSGGGRVIGTRKDWPQEQL